MAGREGRVDGEQDGAHAAPSRHASRCRDARAHSWFGRTTLLLSYWESPEHLQRFAADRDAPHLQPWRDFMRTLQGTGSVGVWHETYQVPVADLEAVYVDMPVFGLAAATAHVPVGPGAKTARQRLGRASRTETS
nr:DUF4188 domain-containing protein [Microbacterium sp. KUDC0406]